MSAAATCFFFQCILDAVMPRLALPLLVLALLGAVGCSAGCMVTLSSAFVQSADTPSGLVNSLLLSGAVAGQTPGGYAVNTTQWRVATSSPRCRRE